MSYQHMTYLEKAYADFDEAGIERSEKSFLSFDRNKKRVHGVYTNTLTVSFI